VILAFAKELAPAFLEMAQQIAALHAVVSASGSRTTSAPRNDSSANSRFACSTIATASFKFSRASSSVALRICAGQLFHERYVAFGKLSKNRRELNFHVDLLARKVRFDHTGARTDVS